MFPEPGRTGLSRQSMPMRHAFLRVLAGVSLALLLAALASCRRSGRRERAAPDRPRYWLRNTWLLDGHQGATTIEVRGLVLVEAFPDGRVRSVLSEQPIDGYLPNDLRRTPVWGTGLARYATRTTEMYLARPDGPVLGLIHAGALVSVGADESVDGALRRVPVALWSGRVVYVDAAALGTSVTIPASLPSPPRARSSRFPGTTVWVRDEVTRSEIFIDTARCRDFFVDDGLVLTQFVDGFELRGHASAFYSPREYESVRCPAHAVFTTAGDEMRLMAPRATDVFGESSQIQVVPQGYVALAALSMEPLAEALRREGEIYWLRYTKEGAECAGWKFAKTTTNPLAGSLTSLSDPTFQHDATYRRPSDGPARLHLSSLKRDGHDFLKCDCSYEYTVVGAKAGEVTMMGRSLPPHTIAYDPGEAERWFLSKESCRDALASLIETMAREPAAAAMLGFHAYTSPEL